MGVKRQQDYSSTCSVVLLGDARVGKSSLLNRALTNKFSESYIKTSSSGEKYEWNLTVAGRNVHFSIVDLGGWKTSSAGGSSSMSKSNLSLHSLSNASHGCSSPKVVNVFQSADVFLLCYRISDPASLFSAINFWCPEIRCYAPTTPIILVGCQSDLRMDREILSTLARRGQAPVSTDQGLTLSQQSGCLYYLETSSKCAPKSAYSVLEVAALAKFGGHPAQRSHQNQHLPRNMSVSLMNLPNKIMPPPVPPKPMLHNNIPTLGTSGHQQVQPKILNHQPPPPMVPPKPRKAVSTMNLNYEHQKENLVIHRPASRSNLLSGSSPRLNFRTSKERSMSSLLSLSGPRTPKLNRKSRDNDKTVTIKCQRLNSERQYEEVEVEVPAPIYDTLRFYNSESSASSGLDTTSSRGSRQSDKHDYNLNKNRTFSAKIRSLFGSRT